ncbi:hypothetical protein [Clostridium botulinum]|uniref:hypothetical protein n=1 Tax=Clostridium botulinum TaxID=1491 RepID=UPI0007744576|nr:hypothetical protein [Clostridium botulinum]NFL40095.1 hypothetical protein [Clostridium botulinum]NFL67174.1 hypothetical protein [Clostridium botulinum]NFN09970.1 hypothetical protein [Clostridium botulinum]NFN33488.1 hypothetical protein [Clostridium botulinum]
MDNLVLITGYKKYNFKNDSGEQVKGAKLTYIPEARDITDVNVVGYLPLQATINDDSIINGLVEVPGLYEAKYKMIPGKNNKAEIKLTGFEFVQPCDFKSCFSY